MLTSWNRVFADDRGCIRYQNGETAYAEELCEGRLRLFGFNTGATGMTAGMNPDVYLRNRTFELTLNGNDLVGDYVFAGENAEKSLEVHVGESDLHAVLHLCTADGSLAVDVHTIFSGSNIFVRYLTLTNRTEKPAALGKITVFGGGLFAAGQPVEVGYFAASTAGQEGNFRWCPAEPGVFSFGREDYPERYRQPFCLARVPGGDSTFVCEMAYSGGYEFAFRTLPGSCATEFSASMAGTAPLLVLQSGESYTTPEVFFGMVKGNTDEAINALTRTISCRYDSDFPKTMAVEASVGPGACEEADVRALIDYAAGLGVEVFYIDAGWYIPKTQQNTEDWPGTCGDWTRTPDRYESTLNDFRELCHKKGMKFGLWLDAEKIGWYSRTYKDRKIAFLQSYLDKDVQDGPCATLVDVTHPETEKWAYEQITYVLDTYQLDYFRLDSGTFPTMAQNRVGDYRENASARYYARWYALFERLRREYPNVIFQNCAGGGMRCDAGMAGRMSNTWISDNNVVPYSFQVVNGMSMQLPMSYLVKIVNGMGAEIHGSVDFVLGATRFGSPLIPLCVLDKDYTRNPYMDEKLRKYVESYKKYVRPMLTDCRVYHHTPEVALNVPGQVGILEVAATGGETVMLGVFTLGQPTTDCHRIRFFGADPAATYTLYCNDEPWGEATGFSLRQGFDVFMNMPYDARVFLAVRKK